MRSLVFLTVIVAVLVGLVVWKVTDSEEPQGYEPPDESTGVALLGTKESKSSQRSDPGDRAWLGEAQEAGLQTQDETGVEEAAGRAPSSPTAGEGRTGEGGGAAVPASTPPPEPPVEAPQEEPEPDLPEGAILYEVQEGDTLYSLVRSAYGTATDTLIEQVSEANQLDDPSALEVGQKLIFPKLEGYAAPTRPGG